MGGVCVLYIVKCCVCNILSTQSNVEYTDTYLWWIGLQLSVVDTDPGLQAINRGLSHLHWTLSSEVKKDKYLSDQPEISHENTIF